MTAPDRARPLDRTLPARFWAKVSKLGVDDCWPWAGSTSRGYGRIHAYGRQRPAAQIAWELEHGQPFPAGLDSCHTCDNPGCVNPRHIWPGTASENARDALEKGRLVNPNPTREVCKRGHVRTPGNLTGRSCTICETLLQREQRAEARRAA